MKFEIREEIFEKGLYMAMFQKLGSAQVSQVGVFHKSVVTVIVMGHASFANPSDVVVRFLG